MSIIVSGSIAYDRIMDFPGYFADHILPEKIHVLNISFTVNGMVEHIGGTAGNIAYAISLLGEKPTIVATIGHDYQRYFEWLKQNGIRHDGIEIIENEFTAGAYITTDKADNQITGFNPGSMKYPTSYDFNSLDPANAIVIIAPGNLQDMAHYAQVCRERDIRYIFDPGQSLPLWNGEDLARSISGATILISNDYELDLIMSCTGFDKKEIIDRAGVIITTLGEEGSKVCTKKGETIIPTVEARKVVDPTGAGDAYRGGLIKGLKQGHDILRCALMGSVCASFAVECVGTQEYRFTREEFQERLYRVSM